MNAPGFRSRAAAFLFGIGRSGNTYLAGHFNSRLTFRHWISVDIEHSLPPISCTKMARLLSSCWDPAQRPCFYQFHELKFCVTPQ
jgi:hypothetical protein